MSIARKCVVLFLFQAIFYQAIVGCSASEPDIQRPPSPTENGDAPAVIELRLDEMVPYRELQLHWMTLEDSRCPVGVTCVWSGRIRVTIEVTGGDEGPMRLDLACDAICKPLPESAYGYEFWLVSVNPYPEEGERPARADYTLQIEIREASLSP
jgi:hypothetical protein